VFIFGAFEGDVESNGGGGITGHYDDVFESLVVEEGKQHSVHEIFEVVVGLCLIGDQIVSAGNPGEAVTRQIHGQAVHLQRQLILQHILAVQCLRKAMEEQHSRFAQVLQRQLLVHLNFGIFPEQEATGFVEKRLSVGRRTLFEQYILSQERDVCLVLDGQLVADRHVVLAH
jgi:hypothetical protein